MTLRIELTYIDFAPRRLTISNHEDLSRTHAALRRDYIRQFRTSLLDPANDREDVAAAAGWNSGGVEHVYALLPGRVAWRLCLCVVDFSLAIETTTRRPTRNSLFRIHRATDRSFVFVGQFSSTERQSFVVVVDVFDRFSRPAVFHRFEQ